MKPATYDRIEKVKCHTAEVVLIHQVCCSFVGAVGGCPVCMALASKNPVWLLLFLHCWLVCVLVLLANFSYLQDATCMACVSLSNALYNRLGPFAGCMLPFEQSSLFCTAHQ